MEKMQQELEVKKIQWERQSWSGLFAIVQHTGVVNSHRGQTSIPLPSSPLGFP